MSNRSVILGISAYYHDSAAALLVNGNLIGAVQEERFTRVKNDERFPVNAIKWLLKEYDLKQEDITAVVFYEKPLLKFERLLETYHAFAPSGISSFLKAMPIWLKDKLFLKRKIKNELASSCGILKQEIYFSEHHLSHSASAFYPSPFKEAAVLTIDGVGEWATCTISKGSGKDIVLLKEQNFPHSLGLLYAAFTYYLGFKVNNGEYKVMGLAAYGDPKSEVTKSFIDLIKKHLVDIKDDGSIMLNMDYFAFATHLVMTHDKKWKALFDLERRGEKEEILQKHANFAYAIQSVTEEIVLKLVKTAVTITGVRNIVLAGGVALNCVVNGKISSLPEVDNLWIQPAAGDAGGAIGAAYAMEHIFLDKERNIKGVDAMKGSLLGPEFSDDVVKICLQKFKNIEIIELQDEELFAKVCSDISIGGVVGWFQGRMEFGPRALGNRSILGDALNPEMQSKINNKIKFRESFRPFAPVVLEEDAEHYFNLDKPSPYMLIVQKVKKKLLGEQPPTLPSKNIYTRLSEVRSKIPAVTHVDNSARIQTVNKTQNTKLYKLLNEYKKLTGHGILINTSFNVKDEPIVCSPKDAIDCFLKTNMDILVINNFYIKK
ncbi:carbamoyltransferase family protein [Galbibacter mesophilus]|uniref:carbamoyltransferase family protein n=1 Tax=Galbibacter mesophilus TaxID=379069 RepID=UPI00191D45C9|nr:carbamoyltransferase N-terminal domain-containing protein [Galbibacter mesophilus]MCM5663893.1 hypothetical protein [Galbibacter mesophilus]